MKLEHINGELVNRLVASQSHIHVENSLPQRSSRLDFHASDAKCANAAIDFLHVITIFRQAEVILLMHFRFVLWWFWQRKSLTRASDFRDFKVSCFFVGQASVKAPLFHPGTVAKVDITEPSFLQFLTVV